MHQTLALKDQEPLSFGTTKEVYQHPADPSLLIKVVKESSGRHRPPAGLLRRVGHYHEYITEIIEYLATKNVAPENARYLETIVGLADTDLGVGLVVKAITTREGDLAPTLAQLVAKNGLSEVQSDALDSILMWVSCTNVIVRDFSMNNLLWDEQTNHFVIIDGVGAKPAYSLRPLWRRYNIHANRKKINKLKSRIHNVMRARSPAPQSRQ